jgi:glycerophosphoryl diester phosphodiesterase
MKHLPPILGAFRHGWLTMLAVHLVVSITSAMVVAPLATLAIGVSVRISGESALSDTAILSFIATPAGAAVALLMVPLLAAIQLLGYSALLIPARAALAGGHCNIAGTLEILTPALPRLLRLSFRFILLVGISSAPFAAGLFLVHITLLGEHDINFYLAEKPPVFVTALSLAAVIGACHLLVVVRLATHAVHALPLTIFQGVPPGKALRLAKEGVCGQRKAVFLGILTMAVATPLVSSVLNLTWTSLAMNSAWRLHDDLGWLVLVLGLCLAGFIATSWLIGFCGLSLLALRNMRLYQESPLDDHEPPPPFTHPVSLPCVRALIAAALAACAFTVFLCHRWIDSIPDDRPAVVIAHRGASSDAPENTLAAVRIAIDAKADWVEIDVQENADGTVVVFHDKDFKRLAGDPRKIWDIGDKDLAKIDIGSWRSPDFSAERTPTLDQALALCKGRAGVIIELKYYGKNIRLEEGVIEAVERAGMSDQVMVMSLDLRGIRRIKELRPKWKTGLLTSVALGNVTRIDVDFLGLNARTTSRRMILDAGKRGVRVYAWTVNDPVDMAALLGRGVDGLITDDPTLAREVIQELRDATPAERLVLEIATYLGKRPPVKTQ